MCTHRVRLQRRWVRGTVVPWQHWAFIEYSLCVRNSSWEEELLFLNLSFSPATVIISVPMFLWEDPLNVKSELWLPDLTHLSVIVWFLFDVIIERKSKGWRIKAAVNTELGLHTSHRLMYSMISRKLKLLHTHTHFSEIQTSSAPSGASFLLPFSVYRCGPHSPPHLSSDLILNLDFTVSYSKHLSHTFNTSMGLPEGFHGDAKVY